VSKPGWFIYETKENIGSQMVHTKKTLKIICKILLHELGGNMLSYRNPVTGRLNSEKKLKNQ